MVLFDLLILNSYNLIYKGIMKKNNSSNEQTHVIAAFTELASSYENKMDSELNLFWGWSYQELIDTLLKSIFDLDHKKVLDLATGKLVIPRAIQSTYPQVEQIVGLDITFRMLQLGKESVKTGSSIDLLCASALDVPLENNTFDLITCALATHHMDGKKLLLEVYRIVKPGGSIIIVDVGASRFWMNPIVQTIIKVLAFIYFFIREGGSRAWAEASALPNIRTAADWEEELKRSGFKDIQITKLRSRRLWIPDPILIHAKKEM